MNAEKILEAITVTAELTGTQLSEIAKAAMVEDLLPYPPEAVMKALMCCRRELTGRLTLAAVLERLNGEDGRPGPDEAWAMALAASDENETVVWTGEIAEASAVAMPILYAGDKVGARMAFKQAYERLLDEARQQGRPAKWQVSLGQDPARRTDAIQQGVEQGKLLPANVQHLLPAPAEAGPIAGLLVGKVDESVNTISRERLAELRRMIADGKARRTQEQEREQRDFEARKQAAIEEVEARLGVSI